MIGDKLVITDYHRAAAARVWLELKERLEQRAAPLAVTVAGESGSGKSEIAHCLAGLVTEAGRVALILGQDDYFRLPPRSNHDKRKRDLSWVGTGEVRLDLLDEHVEALKRRPEEPLTKPLVFFDENRIGSEVVEAGARDVVIAEGTYTTLLQNADLRVFIDRSYKQNRAARLKRARDPDPDFLEEVLAIEHGIISKHKAWADVVIDAPTGESDQ
jgi:uridine kinase